jgi:uncharacterized protein (DUF2147 family)
MSRISAALAATLIAIGALANPNTPVGVWRTIDDTTGKPRGLVELFVEGGELKGKIVRNFPKPGESETPLCTACKGDRRDKPVIGMVFLWGLKQDGETWKGGEILDPDSGNIYSARLELTDGGQKLKVRGFLGVALLGRTQVWVRER